MDDGGVIARGGPGRQEAATLDRWLAISGLVGPLVFVSAFTIAGMLRGGFSPIDETVSDLGIGANAWIVNASAVILGLALIGFATSWFRRIRPRTGGYLRVASAALLALVGVAFAGAGVFPETNPTAHYTAALLFFVGAPFALLLAGLLLRRDPDSRGWARLTLTLALVVVILIALTFYVFSSYTPTAGPEMVGRFGGFMERLAFIVVLAWYAGSGWRLFRSSALAPIQE